ncbi:MAG: SAM-dependent methyltransferase [Magnetococcus sp. WYHC-3]
MTSPRIQTRGARLRAQSLHRELLAAAQDGVVRFDRFMDLSLHHPTCGYYRAGASPLGPRGDFITAPALTALFGQCLTLQVIQVWELLHRPGRFHLVEVGPGNGQLAGDIVATAKKFPDFFSALHLTLVERSAALQRRQRQRLARCGLPGSQVAWVAQVGEVGAGGPITGIILSNEFLDVFPVRWLEWDGSQWCDLGARWTDAGWEVCRMGAATTLPAEMRPQLDFVPVPGYRCEVAEGLPAWIAEAAGCLQRGVLLSIDYGYPAHELRSSSRPMGTLVGHLAHERQDDPLCHPGGMDLTAHVDFTAVARAGELSGLETLGFTSQAWFLMSLGMLQRLETLRTQLPAEAWQRHNDAVKRLLLPDGMGERFKVLAQGRGLDGAALYGFHGRDQRHRLFRHPGQC